MKRAVNEYTTHGRQRRQSFPVGKFHLTDITKY